MAILIPYLNYSFKDTAEEKQTEEQTRTRTRIVLLTEGVVGK